MILSKRERLILTATLVVLGLLVLDRFVIRAALARLNETGQLRSELSIEVEGMQDLLSRRKDLESRWRDMIDNGLSSDPSLTESSIWHELHQWSSECNVALPNVTPQRTNSDNGAMEIIFTIAGRGTMEGIAELLWRIEEAPMPVRIKYLQLGSTNASGQEITLTLRLSVLCLEAAKGPSGAEPSNPASEVSS